MDGVDGQKWMVVVFVVVVVRKQGRGNVTIRVTRRVEPENTSSDDYSDSAHFVSYFPSFSNTSSFAVPWLYR